MKKSVHLMGIGGTGMVALAGLFVEKGWKVRGSDKDVYPPASDELKRLNVEVRNGFKSENLTPRPDLVVVGNVISRNNEEAQALLTSDIPYTSMAQALRDYFLKSRRSVVVAGTHGKSTSTSLMAWILENAGQSPGFFVGAIPLNFGTGCRLGEGVPFVIEGDEYDTAFFEKTPKFLHYRPDDVIITSIEFDHADIYRDLPHVIEQFEKLIAILPKEATVLACGDSETVRDVCRQRGDLKTTYYGLGTGNDVRAVKIQTTDCGTSFDYEVGGRILAHVASPLLGRHNIVNAIACLRMAEKFGIVPEKAGEGISTFKGVRRRQELIGVARGIRVYDDYAHHPTAILETLMAFKPLAEKSGGRLWAIFEPRSNTVRRRVFQKVLPESFAPADRVLLAPVFRKPDTLLDNEMLQPEEVVDSINRLGGNALAARTYEEIVDVVSKEAGKGDIVLFMSNGAFGGIPKEVYKRLSA